MSKLPMVLDERVDVENARLADEGIVADGDRAGLDIPRLRPVGHRHRFLFQDGVVTDGQ
ncbi:hypothetical protein D3C83_212810 [compost metagenome]